MLESAEMGEFSRIRGWLSIPSKPILNHDDP